MFARFASLALAACACASTDAFGQVYYGGYNLGPDYGAMAQQSMARLNNIVKQAEQRAEEAVQNLMKMPEVQARYQHYRQAGGNLSFHQYATWFAATAGGTPEGIRRYLNNEKDIQSKEKAAYEGYRKAQRDASEAMTQGHQRFFENQREMGNVIAGNMTYVDQSGQKFTLPYTQPGYHTDPGTGTVFHLDRYGRYHYMQNNSGWWIPLQPGR